MNQAIEIGRIAADVEVKTTMSGVSVCSFSLAVRRRFPDANGEYLTDFFRCVAWRNTAEFLRKYAYKGQKIAVTGSLQNRSYDAHDGTKRYVTEIICDNVELLESQRDANGGGNGQAGPGGESAQSRQESAGGEFIPEDCGDELPF